MTPLVRIGARTSPLARAQADQVAAQLTALGCRTEFVGITTTGDVDRRHLTQIGGTGVFAQAVRAALLEGEIDLAVHSMKDLPSAPAPGLEIAGIPERENPRDVLIGRRLDELASGMRIGTGSPRRAAQLNAHLLARGVACEFVPIRGNVDRRLGLVTEGTVDATLLAAAGLRRLGRWSDEPSVQDLPVTVLTDEVLVPAAGQGALALEIAETVDPAIRDLVIQLDHRPTRAEVSAEREFLRVLGAGCLAPVGVHGRVGAGSDLTLLAVAGRTYLDDSASAEIDAQVVRVSGDGQIPQAPEIGARLAAETLRLLENPG